jgi:hypothetical protein
MAKGQKGWNVEDSKNLREVILRHYGKKCAKCGIEDVDVLDIDHIHNNGKEEREKLSKIEMLERVLVHPEDYQLLCRNCNWKKYLYSDKLNYERNKKYRTRYFEKCGEDNKLNKLSGVV